MTIQERNHVLTTADAARQAGRKARAAANTAANQPLDKELAKLAEAAALEAYRAAQAAEEAAMSLDPEEALENEAVWEVHCIGMGAADLARKAADKALGIIK